VPTWLPPRLRFPVRPVTWAPPGTYDPAQQGQWLSLLYGTAPPQGPAPAQDEHERQALESEWTYVPSSGVIKNASWGKCVYLKHLDRPQKIRRLIASLEADPRLNMSSMVASLDAAAQDLWHCSLLDLLRQHTGEQLISWPTA
jgi:hypothetical protein